MTDRGEKLREWADIGYYTRDREYKFLDRRRDEFNRYKWGYRFGFGPELDGIPDLLNVQPSQANRVLDWEGKDGGVPASNA